MIQKSQWPKRKIPRITPFLLLPAAATKPVTTLEYSKTIETPGTESFAREDSAIENRPEQALFRNRGRRFEIAGSSRWPPRLICDQKNDRRFYSPP